MQIGINRVFPSELKGIIFDSFGAHLLNEFFLKNQKALRLTVLELIVNILCVYTALACNTICCFLQMGLGKTLQAIAFISYLKFQRKISGPFCRWTFTV